MSTPPPAILIAYYAKHNCWRATAIVDAYQEPGDVLGDSTMKGAHPADALQALLGRRFGILHDAECAPTLVSIEAIRDPVR